MLLSVIALIIVLGVCVSIHELGHYLAARWAGARVDVFSIGFGKPVWKRVDRRGTEWRIAWLPLGGFVSIYGQESQFDRKAYNELPAKEKQGHYLSLPAWKQAIVIAAGVVMNFILAFLIYAGLNFGRTEFLPPVVGKTESAQMQVGDRIMQINGKKINSWDDLLTAKELSGGESKVVILRGEKIQQLVMPAGKWGIMPDTAKTETIRNGVFAAIGRGAAEVWTQTKMIFVLLKRIITGEASGKQLGGFILIAQMSGQAMAMGFAALLSLVAVLCVNLAVINLFPLPVLDGGYLLILALEAAIRRKLQGKWLDWILRICWGLLVALMAFTFWNDVERLIK